MVSSQTIAAISTALGHSGIAVVRISGPDAVFVARRLLRRQEFPEAGHMYLTSLLDSDGQVLDRVLAVRFAEHRSYTGEEIVEIHTHGGSLIARTCLELALRNGARLAEPGEFTLRAFRNGRIDLAQAEGVLGVIQAKSDEALHAAARTLSGELSREVQEIHEQILAIQSSLEIELDFPEGEVFAPDLSAEIEAVLSRLTELEAKCRAGMLLNEGVRAVIAGRPNAGKSSLMNALLGRNRAIVTDVPGTTRDIIEEGIILGGIPVRLTDTAGLREADDVVETEGVRLALEALNESDVCLYVIDSSGELDDEDRKYLAGLAGRRVIVVLNKSDLPGRVMEEEIGFPKVRVSAKSGAGLEDLRGMLYEQCSEDSALGEGLNVSVSQLEEIREAGEAVRDALSVEGEDIVAGLLSSARMSLLRVLGVDAGDELLETMFSRFCVGK